MSATYQHPIRTDIPLTIGYPTSGPCEGYATLHAEGCTHTQRRQSRSPVPFGSDEDYCANDLYMVPPYARTPKPKQADR